MSLSVKDNRRTVGISYGIPAPEVLDAAVSSWL